MNKKFLIPTILLTFFCIETINAQEKEMNVVYGDHHIFTIETPTNWFNDKKAAQSIGLTNFFYCLDDKGKSPKSYMYANGIDKENESEDLNTFIGADLENFKKKYPNAKFSRVEMGHTAPIINSAMISIDNLHDRFKEEVVYLETAETIIVLSFATFSEDDYNKYLEVFDAEFTDSFKYRGNNPKPFLEWQKKNN